MPRFHKPRLSATSPSSPVELVQKFTSKEDFRALAASSTAVALSISSAFSDTHDTSSDGATIQGRDTVWQTAYGTAKMAVEIVNESSDMFLPLKAVVGAVSVLIRNYDQTADNADGVKEIERRVQSLSGVLASPVGESDYAEKGRRVELRRKLEGVIAKLEPLSDQHALVWFLRNVDNAKTLTGFVQELANAIMDYQVSVQQGVYERTRNIHGDTKNILGDVENVLHDTENILGDTKNIHNDTKDILSDTKNILEVADLEILAKLEPVRNAGYQAGHHDKCLPGTRESVFQDIMLWARNPWDQNVFWLNGLAGTGKSTIAQSFSDMIANDGILGASFFCSRDYLDRRELKNIFPTLAYQLACHYPCFRNHIITTIRKDPTLAHTSLISQLENLLMSPLSEAKVSCVIVIDALDECIDSQPASAILSVLGRFAKQLPLVKFFITGRPEPRIRTGFRLPLLEPLTQIFLLHGVESSNVNNDIQLYLTQRLTTIAKQRSDLDLPNPWPCDEEILALTKKSSGLFIFASTLARFIESEHHQPDERLQLVISDTDSTTHEGNAGIDVLYSQVLLHAFSDVHQLEVFANVKCVLGAIVLAFNPLSRKELSKILGISTTLISTTLRHLHSVILIPANEHEEIRIFHKSFPDFLQDTEQCTDPRFYIDPVTHHGGMVLGCLELVKKLKRNPCSLPPFTMNWDIPNLPQLLENKLGGAIRYACRYWARHLKLSSESGYHINQVTTSVAEMLRSAPPWIEAMSLENHLEEVIHSMHCLLDWLDKVEPILLKEVNTTGAEANFAQGEADMAREEAKAARKEAKIIKKMGGIAQQKVNLAWQKADTAEQKAHTAQQMAHTVITNYKAVTALHGLATDCLRLSMHFFHPIQQCAQQVYHSALPLSPMSSKLRSFCLQSVIDNQLSYVTAFSGVPDNWGLLLRTINVRPSQLTCITTFAQRIVAACEDVVNTYDAVTGVLRQSLRAPEVVVKIQGSPEGSILFFAHSFSVTMWDVQTGGLIHTFTTQSKINDIGISTKGAYISCGLSDGFISFWNTRTKKKGKSFGNGQPIITMHWLSPVELAVATQHSFYIHNVSTSETHVGLPIRSPVWGMVYLMDGCSFIVGSSRPDKRTDQEQFTLYPITYTQEQLDRDMGIHLEWQSSMSVPLRQPMSLTLLGDEVACVTPPSGVQLLNVNSHNWTKNPPLLDAAISVAVSMNRNLVVQTKDSIQMFSLDILKTGEAHNNIHLSHIYPLGEKYIVCLQPDRHLTLLELETLEELYPDENPLLPQSLLTNHSSSPHGLAAKLNVSMVMEAWQSDAPLPLEWAEVADEDVLLSRLSPNHTRIAVVYGSLPRRELRVNDSEDGTVLANLSLEDGDLETGEVYDLTFDSETRFCLKVDEPGWHIQIPYDITASSSGPNSHMITRGEPVPLLEPRVKPPYSLDANCEWVLDGESRKICWMSPGNLRRGDGGHFWAGLSLVMVGDDGVVRKVTFKEPDC